MGLAERAGCNPVRSQAGGVELVIVFVSMLAVPMYLLQAHGELTPIRWLKWYLYLVAPVHLVRGLYYHIKSGSLFDFENVPPVRRMMKMCLDSKNIAAIVNGLYLPVAIILIALSLLFAFNWLSLGVYYLSVYLYNGLRFSAPPVVLLLAKSGEPSRDLLGRVIRAASPARALALIRHNYATPRGALIRYHTVRQRDGDEWLTVVSELAGYAKLIVVDARTPATSIKEEIDAIAELGYLYKTMFIVPDDRSTFLGLMVDTNAVRGASGNEDVICEAVKYVTRSPNRLPTSDRTVSVADMLNHQI